MDNERRKTLREVSRVLSSAASTVERVCDRESDCLDNYPENLQGTDRYEKMERAVDSLTEASEKLDEAITCILAAME